MTALLLALALGAQDDVSTLLEQLRGDKASERESAQKSLEKMGVPVFERLVAELGKETDIETKARLKALVERIPKLAQLALVCGPTKRITLSVKDAEFWGVLDRLEGGLGEHMIKGQGLDLKAKITLDLKDVTLWEALDRVAKASRTHYFYRKDGVAFFPGESPELPAVYFEQFRVTVAEVKRIEYRSPTQKAALVVAVLQVQHQRNLTPAGLKYHNIFKLDGIENAAGKDAKGREYGWADSISPRLEYALQEFYSIDPSASPFTITGKATVNFSQDAREIEMPVMADAPEIKTADGTFKLVSAKKEEGRTTVILDIDTTEEVGLRERFKGLWLFDDKDRRHDGIILSMGREGKHFRPVLSFPGEIKDGSHLFFRWRVGLHAIEIPFQLKNIPIP